MAVKGDNLAQSRRAAEKVRLGDIVDIIGGGTPSKKREDFYRGAIPWATVRDMNCDIIKKTEFCITDEAVENSATNVIPKGEVVISTHVGLGKVCVLGQDTAINQDLKAIIPHQGVFRRYMYYWFCSQADILIRNGKGATVKGVTLDFVRALQIPLPPLPTQRRIAAELDKICELKKNAERRLEKLDLLVKSRFGEMFGSSDCAKVTIGEVVDRNIGSAKRAFSSCSKIKYIDISSIDNIRNVVSGCREYVFSEAPSRAQQHIQYGDILVSTVRPNLKNVAVTPFKDDNLVASSGFCVLRAVRCLPEYLMAVVCSDEFTSAMIKVVNGANYPAIKDSDVLNYVIKLPPINIQTKFAAFVEKVDKLRVNVREAVAKMDMLYRSKLQEYFG